MNIFAIKMHAVVTSVVAYGSLRKGICSYRYFLLAVLLLGVAACSDDKPKLPEPSEIPAAATHKVSYHDEVRPIIEQKCLACHGCFDAPCQFKLESPAALLRGAHHLDVYDGKRTEGQALTRLNIDAESEEGWRKLGFYSVLDADAEAGSLFYNMLLLGKKYSLPANSKIDETIQLGLRRENQCVTPKEFPAYAESHPLEGMPLAMTGLTDKEFSLISGWIKQGAKVTEEETSLTEGEQIVINFWEDYLNQTSIKQQVVARWLYEHLFLAHIYFEDTAQKPRFFELIRSYTPPGKPIEIVRTRLPNNDPLAPFYYRLRMIEGAIVHKRHITFKFDEELHQQIEALFFSENWTASTLPGYEYAQRANPFKTFADIPANARYQFMLAHAEYFTRTFIRGPVCRGQIATDVIRDHFWLLFQDPQRDLFVTDKGYQEAVMPLLGLPGQNDDLLKTGKNWEKYKTKRNEYHKRRNQAYREHAPEWASVKSIWDGDGNNSNAALTIFRHFDSASVQQGLIGQLPETIWWMDYPLFERGYYELVVNFDVFGNLAHQLQTRLYFDLIRNGAEYNFLRLLPAEVRQQMVDEWYSGLGALKTHITYAPLDSQTPTAEQYTTDAVKDELARKLLQHLQAVNTMDNDRLNRCSDEKCFRDDQPHWIQLADIQLAKLTAKQPELVNGIRFLPEMTLLRVTDERGERTVYSIIRNRAHSNVAFMFGESLRHQPERDTLTLYPGIAGSYPNFIFDVPASQIAAFREQLTAASSAESFEKIVMQWGVRRTHPQFWEILHDFTKWHRETEPLEAGILDVNRYENL